MVRLKNLGITQNEKFKWIKDLIEFYDDGTHTKDDDKWYGDIFDKLMDQSNVRLKNMHSHIMKKKENA